ncbi:dienelactone hydrolase family protein [Streptomonospora sp. S1-112]|uniref:Dienelactone hydrolase family protein n=1 Tax=Streptomonospora mangrovi TaxID=2883123 RepID=A0A9X3NZJ5_9ACTN|nr:phosphoribosyltransferase family protein [Streptomonospora mangrovi]MDA0567216.1 dienelactone hydrolase family protein [Streptomonospora mangrovi]
MNPLPVSLPFTDRAEAGRRLAERVRPLAVADPLVLALPRGGVPVGAELARLLGIPLDVLIVRKIGVPGHPELGVGALAEDGRICYDDRALARLRLTRADLADTVEAERAELARRVEVYRRGRAPVDPRGRDVVVVDDGIATGGTARAALRMVRRREPARLLLAVPVAAQAALDALAEEADRVVALTVPDNFHAVGEWYRDFTQLTDSEVTALLDAVADRAAAPAHARAVRIRSGDVDLEAELATVPGARGTVVLALGREREDPARRAVAAALGRAGYTTLLLDLLTPEEDAARRGAGPGGAAEPPAAVPARRLEAAVGWLLRSTDSAGRRVGLFGAGAGVPAALAAAAARPADIAAVALHGGRPDLAAEALPGVRAPVLALVQGGDSFVRELVEWSLARVGGPHRTRTVPGAEELLDTEAGRRTVGEAAVAWFERHL